jgi:hypothetical protein
MLANGFELRPLEILDLTGSTTCSSPVTPPWLQFVYFVTFHNGYFVACADACDETAVCYRYVSNGNWEAAWTMPSDYLAYNRATLQLGPHETWIIGGSSISSIASVGYDPCSSNNMAINAGTQTDSTLLVRNGEAALGPLLPEMMYGPCIVRINATHGFLGMTR